MEFSRSLILAAALAAHTAPATAQLADQLRVTSFALLPEISGSAEFVRESYAGRDSAGVPHYLERPFSEEEKQLLRQHFGIEEPGRLYLSDSTASAYLTYDTERDPGAQRLVRSYRVGAGSIRRPGETWEELERRLRHLRPRDFPASVRKADKSIASLDPVARPHFARLLAAARRAGHRVRVTETLRSPERQAYLLVLGGGLTFTATSSHSAGRAADIVVADGNLRNPRTRARWVAFREWVAAYDNGRFQLIGTADKSWDWPHVELAEGPSGFRSIEELLEAAHGLHSTHESAPNGATSFAGSGSDADSIRGDGAAGWAAVPAR